MTVIGIGIGVGYATKKANGIPIPLGEFLTPDTWARNTTRFSLATGLLLGLNEPDDYCKGGRHISGISEGAELLRTNTNWFTNSVGTGWLVQPEGTTIATQEDSRIVRVQTSPPLAEADRKFWAETGGSGNGPYSYTVQVMSNVPGVPQSFELKLGNAGSNEIITTIALAATDEWEDVTVIGVTDGATPGVRFLFDGADDTDILIRDPITTVGNKKYPQFPQGSAQGVPYTADVATATAPAWPALPVAFTNIIDTDVNTWGVAGDFNNIRRTDLGNGTTRIEFLGTGPIAARFFIPDLGLDRTGRMQARLVENAPGGGVGDFIGFRLGPSSVGTTFLMSELTSAWQDADFAVPSTTNSDEVVIRTDGNVAFAIEVRAVRAVDDVAIPTLAFLPGTLAGETQTAAVIAMAFDNFTTGEIDGIAYGAQVAGDFIYDGDIYGNGEYISFLSAGIPTQDQIDTALAILQTFLTQPVGPCDVDFLTDGEGPPNLLVDDEGTPNVLTAP